MHLNLDSYTQAAVRTILQHAPAGIAVMHGPSHIIDTINDTFLAYLGFDRTEVLNSSLSLLLERVSLQRLQLHFDKAFHLAEDIVISEVKMNGDEKNPVYLKVTITPLKEGNEPVTGLLVMAYDITDQVRARISVEESEKRYASLVHDSLYRTALLEAQNETIPDGMLIVDTKGKMIYFNSHFAELWGMPQHILDRHDDKAALQFAMEQLVDPDSFINRVKYLYSHSNEASREEIHFKNGKILERFGSAILGEDGHRFGWLWYFRDVTAERKMEKELEVKEESIRIALEGAEMGSYDFYLQTEKLFLSSRAKEHYGLSPHAEVTVDIYKKGIHPEDYQKSLQIATDLRSGKNGTHYENEYRTIGINDGKLRWIRSKGKLYFDKEGKPERLVGITQDISRQKQIIESLKLQSLVLESMEEGVSISDEEGIIRLTNPAEDAMFGYEKGELLNQPVTIQNAYPPEENNRIVSSVIEELKTKGFWKGEWHNKKKDGSLFFTYSYITSLKLNDDTLFVCVQRDITKEKKLHEQLRESEQTFRHLANAMPQLVWMADNQGEVYYYNDRIKEYGFKQKSDGHYEWNIMLHEDDVEETERLWTAALSQKTIYEAEHRVKLSDGNYRWHLSRGFPDFDGEGNVLRWLGTATDIHEQKVFAQDLEARVQVRTRELELKNEELEQFAYVASHDLQEPLRKIITFSGMVMDSSNSISARDKSYLEKVIKASSRMSSLIRDILHYSRIDSMQAPRMEVDLNTIISNVLEDFEIQIVNSGAKIHCQKLPVVTANAVQMNQLFSNLISNALKFKDESRQSEIQIKYERIFNGERLHKIIVEDNGIGFDPRLADQIFTVFQRLNSSFTYAGTGIGLALCRKIVNAHGGRIYAEAQVGAGSRFIIEL